MKLKKFTEETYQTAKETNSKDNPFDISEYDKDSIIKWHNTKGNKCKKLWLKATCVKCKKAFILLYSYNNTNITLCKMCKTKQTNTERYGTESVFQCKEIREKGKTTMLKKYGVDNYSKSDEWNKRVEQTNIEKYGKDYINKWHKKAAKTNLEKYGTENVFASDEIKEKIKQTNLEKYGCEHNMQSEEVKAKSRKTCFEHYGVEHPSQSEEIMQRKRDTCLQNYGVEYPAQSEVVRNKMRNTTLERYGKEYYTQTEEGKQKYIETCLERYGVENTGLLYSNYIYDNINFDSKWEIAFYIYHKDNGHKIIREPKSFSYTGNDKIEHHYFPDFKVGNKYYEIKGDQFLEFYKNGNPKTLKNNKEKYNCMKKHNVILIWSKQIKKYIDYVNKIYGDDYLDKFKIALNKQEKETKIEEE